MMAVFICVPVAPGLSAAHGVVRFGIPPCTPACVQSMARAGSRMPPQSWPVGAEVSLGAGVSEARDASAVVAASEGEVVSGGEGEFESAGGAGVSAAASAAGESEVAVDRVSAMGAKASRAASAAGGGVAWLLEPQPISQTASNSATVRMRYSIPRGITPWWIGSVKQRGGGDDRSW